MSSQVFSKFKDFVPFKKTTDLNYSKDFGNIKIQEPMGIFIPKNVSLLAKFIQVANEHGVNVVCRGQAHSVYGQALCKNGVIIDLKSMEGDIELTSSGLTVPAGKTWGEVVSFALKQGMMLPVLTDYLKLSIGGTLSLGGFGGSSYLHGSQADNVIDADIISPKYGLISNAKENFSDLFHATLCSLGQFGIITQVQLPLIPLRPYVKLFQLHYLNFENFINDQKYLFKCGEFSHLKGSIVKKEGNWHYTIEVAIFFEEPHDSPIPKSLSKNSSYKIDNEEMLYIDFVNKVTNYVDKLMKEQKYDVPHPLYNVFLPEEAIAAHLQLTLDNPYLKDTDPIIVYPINSDKLQQPFFIKPPGKIIYIFALMYNCSHEAISNFPYEKVLRKNYSLYQDAHSRGGSRYPFDAIPFNAQDWKSHYQNKWFDLLQLKEKYDPNHILGRNIFQLPAEGDEHSF